jgi:excisionase family DNA binding protein
MLAGLLLGSGMSSPSPPVTPVAVAVDDLVCGAASAQHEYLTSAEVADLARITRRSVWRLVADGRLPAVKIGRRSTRFLRSDVEALLHPRRREPLDLTPHPPPVDGLDQR